MSKQKYVDFKAVKAAITMEQVLKHYGVLDKFKRSGESLSGPCPIHKGSNATQFRVNTSRNIWKCFSECENGGNVLDFIVKMEKVGVLQAANKAIEWFKLDLAQVSTDEDKPADPKPTSAKASSPKPEPVEETKAPNKPLKFKLDKLELNHPYLIQERGLALETIVDFGIGYCNKGLMAGRIAIPIHNIQGEVVAYAGRIPQEKPPEDTPKYKLPPGFHKSLELFNLDRAIQEPADEPLLIVEGFFDCMKIHENGWRKVVALMGSSMSAAQETLIREHFKSTGHIIVILDENDAGRVGRIDIASRLVTHCFVKVHKFDVEDKEPEHLSNEELTEILEGVQ